MKLLKPGWIHLDGRQIFSIDIDPRGRYLAVAGQGENNCGKIVVFNFEQFAKFCPNVNLSALGDEEHIPRKLFELNNHLGCVNCVRWSPDGKVLASGSDDRVVMIWQPVSSPSSSQNSGATRRYPDQGRCLCMLREHTGDVLDLAWNRDGSILASCSIDNSIIVWNASKFPTVERIVTLKKHSGLVKGICFDPAGMYLASQADDKTLIVWRTSDWSVETKISEPFKECSGTTHVLRTSWAPDGQTLITAHAMNSGGPTAQLICRGPPWSTNVDLAGHRRAVTCTRFHPRLLTRPAEPPLQSAQNGATTPDHDNKIEPFCAVAVGSRDRSFSVWLTNIRRPRMVLQDVFSDSVLDLSWFQHCLFACSVDGTVACVVFSETEIGKVASEHQTAMAMQAACSHKDSYKRPEKVIIQSAALLAERKKIAAEDAVSKQPQPQKHSGSSHSEGVKKEPVTNGTSSSEPKETKQKEPAKEDQQPPPPPPPPPQSTAMPPPPSAPAPSPTTAAPAVTHRPSFLINNNNNQSNPFPTAAAFNNADLMAKCLSPQPTQPSKQIETKLPNGKRRITPMVVPLEPLSPNGFSLFDNASAGNNDLFSKPQAPSSSVTASTPLAAPTLMAVDSAKPAQPQLVTAQTPSSEGAGATTAVAPPPPPASTTAPSDRDVVKVTASRFLGAKPCAEELKVAKPTKRPIGSTSATSVPSRKKPGRPPVLKPSGQKRPNRIDSSSSSGDESDSSDEGEPQREVPQKPAAAPPTPSQHVHHGPVSILPPAKLPVVGRNSKKVSIAPPSAAISRTGSTEFVVSVSPMDDQSGMWLLDCSPEAAIQQQSHQNRLWLQVLPSQCTAFAVSKRIVAVADNSARLSVFVLKTGSRLAGPYTLPSSVAFLECTEWRCLAVLTCGALRIWDTKPPATPVCLISATSMPLLRDNERFRRCFISECGAPVLVSSLNRSYLYSSQQQTWIELGESLSNSLKNDTDSSLSNAIATARVSTTNLSAKALGNADIQRAALKDALARNVVLAQETRLADDYLSAVMAYFRFMVREEKGPSSSISFEAEIRELFGSLLCANSANGQSFLSSQARCDLIRDLLSCLATNLRYQQLFVEIESQVESVQPMVVAKKRDDGNKTINQSNGGTVAMNCD